MEGIQGQGDTTRSVPPNTVRNDLPMTPAPYIFFQKQTPKWRLSPQNNGGSTLYDSYELRAVTEQLNRTIQGTQIMYSPCPTHTKFIYPFRGYLDRVYQENAKTPKRITNSKLSVSVLTVQDTIKMNGDKKNLIPRLWTIVKRKFWNKRRASTWICSQTQTSTPTRY